MVLRTTLAPADEATSAEAQANREAMGQSEGRKPQ
jgi:hypothetical protein